MATPGKGTKKEKKQPVKTSLDNPYPSEWKALEKGHARFILKTVTVSFNKLELRKRRVQVYRKWGRKRKGKKANSDSVDTSEPTQESQESQKANSDSVDTSEPTQESQESHKANSDSVDTSEPTQESQELQKANSESVDTSEPTQDSKESQERGWTNRNLRKELAIGINEVTKGLERNELSLVLVCDSVKPRHMTSHLIGLSRTRSVPACQVPGLSATVAPSLGLTSVLALGFKRQSSAFADAVASIETKVPPLSVAWVPTETGTGVSQTKAVLVSGETEPTGSGAPEPGVVLMSGETKEQLQQVEAGRGSKRKLEDSPEVKQDPVTLLQPLKVKKIIPNPSKIRKVKRKKVK